MDAISARVLWPRIILAFAVAPLTVPLIFFVVTALLERGRGSSSEFIGTLLTYGPYAYIFALLLGIPAFWLLKRGGALGLWPCALVGGAIGLIGSVLLSVVGLKAIGILIGGLAGVVAGIVFCLVAGLLS
jgi:hypothetical protein